VPVNVKLLADLLTIKGYDVVTAATAPSARQGREGPAGARAARRHDAGDERLRRLPQDPGEPRDGDAADHHGHGRSILPGACEGDRGGRRRLPEQAHQPARASCPRQVAARITVLHEELADWNRTLAQAGRAAAPQLDRLERLKRFFSPQLAELIVSARPRTRSRATGARSPWSSSISAGSPPSPRRPSPRRSWACCAIPRRDGRLSWRTRARSSASPRRDVIFSTTRCRSPTRRSARYGWRRDARKVDELLVRWRRRGYELDFGVGSIRATRRSADRLRGRMDYGAIGTVTNMAARLCGEAKSRQILISQRVLGDGRGAGRGGGSGQPDAEGFSRPVPPSTCSRYRGPERRQIVRPCPAQ